MTQTHQRWHRAVRTTPVLILSAFVLTACGGGGGGGGGGGAAAAPSGTLSGTATKGPVSAATVTAYSVANGARSSMLGSATTDSSGNFTMHLNPYSGPMMLEMRGGSYDDEATGHQMNMMDADDMTCVLPSVTVTDGSAMTGIQITPLTSMAQSWASHMPGGMTMANITLANEHVGAVYVGPGADIVMTHPIDPTMPGSANGAGIEEKNYGMMLAAMSQEAHEIGMTASSGMVTAMLDDASDGIMDGMMGGMPISMSGMGGMMGGGNMMPTAGTSQLMTAMSDFVTGPMNHSGVTSMTEMQSLMDQMAQFVAAGGHF